MKNKQMEEKRCGIWHYFYFLANLIAFWPTFSHEVLYFQASPESTEVAEPEQTEAAPTSAAVPAATVSTVSPPATVEATEADDVVVEPPQQISPAIQVNPDPEPAALQPQPEAPAPVPPVPPPEVKVEEPPKEEKVATPAENGVGDDAEPVVDKTRPKHMINGVQLNYKEGNDNSKEFDFDRQFDITLIAKWW